MKEIQKFVLKGFLSGILLSKFTKNWHKTTNRMKKCKMNEQPTKNAFQQIVFLKYLKQAISVELKQQNAFSKNLHIQWMRLLAIN